MSLKLAAMFGNHMVVQQQQPAWVWGWAGPGQEIAVSFAGQTKTAAAAADGQWRVQLAPLPASAEPRELVVHSGNERVELSDVLVGEVWLCSGQSNMQWPVGMGGQAEAEVAQGNHPQLRHFTVPNRAAIEPQRDLNGGRWEVCTPLTVSNFSAVAYYFGRELLRRLQVPVGLINASWSGSVVEAWISREGLQAEPEGCALLATYARDQPRFVELPEEWERQAAALAERTADQENLGFARGWAAVASPAGEWKAMKLPRAWQGAGLDFSGVFWFRKEVELPAAWAGQSLSLGIGACDKSDLTYFNNVPVGSVTMRERADAWSLFRNYRVPGQLVNAGRNVIAVRVHSHLSAGGLTGPAAVMQLGLAGRPETAFSLAGTWQYAIEQNYGMTQLPGPNNPSTPAVLYGGMIAPVLPFALQGAIWYQGETNAHRPAGQYRRLFSALINDWRRHWERDFPFLFVQLPNYMAQWNVPGDSQWAELREAQTTALSLPKTGMAVAIDLGEAADIHPKNKQDVGLRLALNALATTYGWKHVAYSGPMFEQGIPAGRQVRLQFRHTNGGLVARGGPLKGFAIAGADGRFHWADAVIDGSAVVVSCPQVPKPVAVRYAWADNPDCNLYNGAGLPACPFRTGDMDTFNHPNMVGPRLFADSLVALFP